MPRYRDLTHTARPSDAPRVVDPKNPVRTTDPGTLQMLKMLEGKNIETVYDRVVAQQPQCTFGYKGVCCRICIAGPCRVKKDEGPGSRGICGASAYTIVSRNLVRLIAGGTASHSEHARHVLHTAHAMVEGHAPDYEIKSPAKLHKLAQKLGISTIDREDKEILREVVELGYADFGRYQDRPLAFLDSFLTEGRRKKFLHTNVMPKAIDGTVTELIAQTAMGVDNDPVNIIFGGLKAALADLGGEYIGTNLSDVLFGIPEPIVSEANLGVIDPKMVNIAVHGHNPVLSEMVVAAARKMKAEAQKVGAEGINIVGICCTGNELLMREGVYLATSSASQEMAIMTGALDAMVVDIQCIYPSVQTAAECFHTKVITTEAIMKTPGAQHVAFKTETAMEDAQKLVSIAIEAYKHRDPKKISIPSERHKLVAGFSIEALTEIFAKICPERPISVLTDAILSGQLKGVALMAGCNNLKRIQDEGHVAVLKELVKNDVFVIATGCSAGAYAKFGLMSPLAVDAYAGEGLKSFLKTLEQANPQLSTGLPLVFHVGSCVDNSRGIDLAMAMANELGVDVPKVPFVASAPEAMHEKAVAIGTWAVTMGLPTHVGSLPPLEGSDLVYGIATQIAHDVFGGNFIFEVDPVIGAQKLLDALEYRTWKLGVHKKTAEKNETSLAQGW
ncbi:anaerobic carbon-monoxide dehydrogenase catalytic subunit [Desulfosporosinus sp. PR]|uniref:anaerobic carbon-monoxide dehydrogenase catalytic subunit n=1 Tax=Candidatus Desulfosporosinus nitrosoreducens TaxID=3401928 RepID=UPI0027FB3EA2|nr:anaerobic carbon-monoxide dehydrogenase catalytic subunit [Desulfosporosinus sp. PR]MDQ7094932.1 anaerobic carbon-monoxide dehydrogenase catalytic subunit [Desulfosporosinus sp. PR]